MAQKPVLRDEVVCACVAPGFFFTPPHLAFFVLEYVKKDTGNETNAKRSVNKPKNRFFRPR